MNLKLINNLNFGEKINAIDAVTESGKEMLKRYKSHIINNCVTCGLVNGFIQEANQFTYDAGIRSILASVLNYISENKISWKLSSVCESIENNNSSFNYIAKMGVPQIEKLLEMNEATVVQYIKAGALKNLQMIPEVRNVCKEVYKSNVVEETYAPNYSLTNTVSYLLENEDGKYFAINGKTFLIDKDHNILEASVEDVKFNRINSLLPNFKIVSEAVDGKEVTKLVYNYEHGIFGKALEYEIQENSIKFKSGNFEKVFENVNDLHEYADLYARALNGNERNIFLNISNSIAEVYEAMENVVELDNSKILHTANGNVLAIIEGKDNINVTVFNSNIGKSSTNFQTMNEALETVKNITGLSLNNVYENRINEDAKKFDAESYENIKEELEKSKQNAINERRKKIEMLSEQFKNDPVRIALLNGIARDLAILEN